MSFTIVAVRLGVSIFNRRGSPREALFLASSRVQEGVEAVQVFEPTGEFVSVSVLAAAAQHQSSAVASVQRAVDAARNELLSLKPGPYVERMGLSIRVGAERVPDPRPVELRATVARGVSSDTQSIPTPARAGRVRVFRAQERPDRIER